MILARASGKNEASPLKGQRGLVGHWLLPTSKQMPDRIAETPLFPFPVESTHSKITISVY
jgi:hypothetical protein